MTRKAAFPVSFLCSLMTISSTVSADTLLGIYLGAGNWRNSYSGDFASNGENKINIQSDLNFDDDSNNNFFYAALEHPIPLLPNIRVTRAQLEDEVSTTLTRSFTFSDQTFSTGEEATTQVDLSHTDATFYYEFLDNWISLDLGLTVRNLVGDIVITSSTQTDKPAETNVDVVMPLLYGFGQFQLPFTGFHLAARFNGVTYSGIRLTELDLSLGYESAIGLGGELGYRRVNLSLDDVDDFNSDLDIDGAYAAVTFHF